MKRPHVLPQSFYSRPTLTVLEELIGKVLVHDVRGRRTAGIIVEAEAYIGEADPACHAAPGPTKRNQPLYGPPGFAYVYLNYGIHHPVNAVTEPEGFPAAVLIRALAPIEGIDLMRRRRGWSASTPRPCASITAMNWTSDRPRPTLRWPVFRSPRRAMAMSPHRYSG